MMSLVGEMSQDRQLDISPLKLPAMDVPFDQLCKDVPKLKYENFIKQQIKLIPNISYYTDHMPWQLRMSCFRVEKALGKLCSLSGILASLLTPSRKRERYIYIAT